MQHATLWNWDHDTAASREATIREAIEVADSPEEAHDIIVDAGYSMRRGEVRRMWHEAKRSQVATDWWYTMHPDAT